MQQVLGQDRAKELLQAALRCGRMHHALVFYGPQGVGKFTLAWALARTLLCPEPRTLEDGTIDACGTCESCRLIPALPPTAESSSAGPLLPAHPDLHVVTKELAAYSDDKRIRDRKQMNIPADVLEQRLIVPVQRSSQRRHGKVFIVDEAELIDEDGQNKLLKTLEEPPSQTYIILVTSHENRLLPTVRSRCQRIGFGPLSPTVLTDWLSSRQVELSPNEQRWIIDFAQGSLGRLQLAVDYDLVRWARAVLPSLEQARQGQFNVELGKTIAQSIDEFAQEWVKRHHNASKEAANRLGAGLMGALLSQYARRQITLLANEGEAALMPWLNVIEAIHRAQMELSSYLNLGQVCEQLSLTIQRDLAGGR